MGLKEEIMSKKNEIIVDSYKMSIGEIINIYKDGELDVHPEFQRIYRWSDEQKSKLIESILLGIPIPSIFVAQKLNGKWDVIDGQQRLSTILQFAQVLRKENGEKYDPLILKATKFLPSLDGVRWDNDDLFPEDQKIVFKREKLDFTIIKETGENDSSKYEMFQRLNTGGTHLTPQELRNCLLIMINKQLYDVIDEMNQDTNFRSCVPLTETKSDESYDKELVVRYLLYISFSDEFLDTVDKSRNMDVFLTEQIENMALGKKQDFSAIILEYKRKFTRIFALLNKTCGNNAFKKYKDGQFKGPVLISAFEAIIPGLFLNLDYWENHRDELKTKIKQLYNQSEFDAATRRGTRALDRMCQLVQFSREWFSHEA